MTPFAVLRSLKIASSNDHTEEYLIITSNGFQNPKTGVLPRKQSMGTWFKQDRVASQSGSVSVRRFDGGLGTKLQAWVLMIMAFLNIVFARSSQTVAEKGNYPARIGKGHLQGDDLLDFTFSSRRSGQPFNQYPIQFLTLRG